MKAKTAAGPTAKIQGALKKKDVTLLKMNKIAPTP
jgi:hypothetical protein